MIDDPLPISLSISKYNFNHEALDELEDNRLVRELWPLVYIISNSVSHKAYVGESANWLSRMRDHLNDPRRSGLKDLHIITSDKFNKSVALDIETNLIRYISGQEFLKLQNGNPGLRFHNYFQKDKYEHLFGIVWQRLLDEGLVQRDLEHIDTSSLFKYSPYKALSDDQYTSVKQIIKALTRGNKGSIFISGSAGTGKTILAVFLIKLLKTDLDSLLDTSDIEDGWAEYLLRLKQKYADPNVALVVPMPSLRFTLKRVFANVPGLHPGIVIGPAEVLKNKYDIVLIDEAHRLRRRVNLSNYQILDVPNALHGFEREMTELDWMLNDKDRHQIFFYDPAQTIKPSDVTKDDFSKAKKAAVGQIELTSQFRVKGGRDYIRYIDKLLNGRLKTGDKYFESDSYEFLLFDSPEELINKLKEKEDQVELCRLVAGYSWKWESKKKDKKHIKDIKIGDTRLKWNSPVLEWIYTDKAKSLEEVGCIHTTQGYDLNYTGVIFGRDISYDGSNIVIDRKNYHDRNGKSGIEDDNVLKEYIINIYKTLMYRGISGTYVYVCDEKLRKYFEDHIPIFKAASDLKTTADVKELPPFEILRSDKVRPYVNSVPVFDLKAAAGNFSSLQNVSQHNWIRLPEQFKPQKGQFVCQVIGESMNKKIPNGSWCLFRKDQGESPDGKIVLVEHSKIQDDIGSGYTVKEYQTKKRRSSTSAQSKIVLKPRSTDPSFQDLILTRDELAKLKIRGIFVAVLKEQQV